MTQIKKLLGTSVISLLLMIWGLFMVCSGRVPDVALEDEMMTQEEGAGQDNELMNQLAVLDDGSSKLEESQKREILQALGIEPTGSEATGKQEEDFLSEELFLDLEVEIAELEKQAKTKTSIADSLKLELQDADLRLAALNNVVPESSSRYASTSSTPIGYKVTNGSSSEYGQYYHEALNDVYEHRYQQAIAKFQDLLKLPNTENLADNAQYWIGESYYGLGKYELAIAEFEKVEAFEKNNKSDDAQFMIGMAYIRMGDSRLAQIELNNLLTFYQNSEYIARAEKQLNELNI